MNSILKYMNLYSELAHLREAPNDEEHEERLLDELDKVWFSMGTSELKEVDDILDRLESVCFLEDGKKVSRIYAKREIGSTEPPFTIISFAQLIKNEVEKMRDPEGTP